MPRSKKTSKTTRRQPTRSANSIDYRSQWNALAKIDYNFYVEYTNPGYIHEKHTEIVCDYLQRVESGEIKRLMIFMPPRHSKSYTVSETFPSWFIGRKPSRKVIEVSYGEDLALQFGRANLTKIKQHGSDIFGIKAADDLARSVNWGLQGMDGRNKAGGMISVGLGGAITGKGADLLIIDDPIKNSKEANSKTYRDWLHSEYKTTLYTRLQPGGAIIMIFTRWHQDDLAGRILSDPETKQGWTILSIPCIAEENDILGRQPGEPLSPVRGYDKAWAEQTKKDVGSKVWASLYQQKPSPDQGQVFRRDWLQYYRKAPDRFDIMIASWDLTFKDVSESDYVVGQLWGKKAADYYLLDQIRAKMDFPGTVQAIRSFAAKHPLARGKLVEDKANGPAVIATLKREISGLVPVNPDGSKEARAQAVSPLHEAGNVFYPDPSIAPWIGDHVEEVVAFPSGANDDQVDAETQALNYLSNKFKKFGAVDKPAGM